MRVVFALTTVVAEEGERFGKAYLRWARPVAIREIKPDLTRWLIVTTICHQPSLLMASIIIII